MATFAERLKELRKEKGLIQTDLANEIGVVTNTVSIIERDGIKQSYEDGAAALKELTDKYEVKEIIGSQMKIKIERQRPMTTQERLAQAYAAVAGDER